MRQLFSILGMLALVMLSAGCGNNEEFLPTSQQGEGKSEQFISDELRGDKGTLKNVKAALRYNESKKQWHLRLIDVDWKWTTRRVILLDKVKEEHKAYENTNIVSNGYFFTISGTYYYNHSINYYPNSGPCGTPTTTDYYKINLTKMEVIND